MHATLAGRGGDTSLRYGAALMAAPLSFTIVTPCLNAEATIEQALHSVRDQGYEHVEHVVVDGGSTDATMEIVRAAPGVRWVSEPDRGLSDAMNKGVAMATGDVVGWLNADDLYLPGALASVSAALAPRPDTLWATGRCVIVDRDGQEIRRGVTRYKDTLLRRWSFPLFLTQNFVSAPSTFVRREAFELVGGFDEGLRYSMDYDLWLRLGRRSAPAVIDERLACFRMVEGTLSMSGFEDQFREHLQNARDHGDGHRLAVTANAAMSWAIVGAYRAMRALRARR
jgi:glycosyltransferase involved in cell wall biosynthesis